MEPSAIPHQTSPIMILHVNDTLYDTREIGLLIYRLQQKHKLKKALTHPNGTFPSHQLGEEK